MPVKYVVMETASKPRPVVPDVGSRGKPLGGRMQALAILDTVLNEELSRKKIKEALRERLHDDPFKFFMQVVVPLLPKQQDVVLSGNLEATTSTPDQMVRDMDGVTVVLTKDGKRRHLTPEFKAQIQRPKEEPAPKEPEPKRVRYDQ